MAIDLVSLAHSITDEEFAKIVISSGDFFPGFYRFTMGDRNHESGQLSLRGLLSAYFDQVATGKQYTREQWTEYAKVRHAALDSRNASRSDSAVYNILDNGYLKWMVGANEYDIAVIEIDSGVTELVKDQTYFFMGSLIRFTDNKLLLGYDLLRDTAVNEVTVPFNIISEYTHMIYKDNLKDFFLPADIIASLDFLKDNQLIMSDVTLSRAMTSDANNIIIASNRDVSKHIPIRWAKDIILSEVTEL